MSQEFVNVVSATPTISTGIYASGDLIGGKLSFTGAGRGGSALLNGAGRVVSAVLTDLAKQSANVDLLLFDADPDGTTFTDNAAFDVADADLTKVAGVVQFTSYAALADNSVGFANNVNLGFDLGAATTLYGALVSRGTPTYVSTSDLTVRLAIDQS